MRTGDGFARVDDTATIREAVVAITQGQGRATAVVASNGTLAGYLSDGDVRRLLITCQDAGVVLQNPGN